MTTGLWPRLAAFTLTLACAIGALVAAGLAEEAPAAGANPPAAASR